MKRNSILSCILTAALCLSLFAGLTGCGDKKNETPDPSKPNTEPGKSGQTDTVDPEFVYVPEYVDVQGEFNNGFDNLLYHDGRFLTSTYCKIGERELEEGEVLEWEGQNWIWGNKLFWLSLDGKVEEITGYTPLTVESVTGEPAGDGASAGGDAPVTTLEASKKAIAIDDGGAYLQRPGRTKSH